MKRMLTLITAVLLVAACEQRAPDPALSAVVDRQAIDQLIAGDYPRALDSGQWEAYADNFTEDGELSLLDQAVKGRQAIIDFVSALPADNRVVHVITNLSYEIQGDTATGGAYWQDVGMANNAPAVVAAGHYDDTLRKVNGAWKIANRAILIDFVPTAAAAPAAASSSQ
jgi:ketosteroid isomerase-like protein